MPEHVAEHERRRLEPRDAPQRAQVGLEREVAVALLPARDRVAGHGIHLHVERKQVVAALDGVLRLGLLDEELPVQALPHQPALHVCEGDDDGVDLACCDLPLQLVEREHADDPTPSLTCLDTKRAP